MSKRRQERMSKVPNRILFPGKYDESPDQDIPKVKKYISVRAVWVEVAVFTAIVCGVSIFTEHNPLYTIVSFFLLAFGITFTKDSIEVVEDEKD